MKRNWTMKRLLAMILTFVLLTGCLPLQAIAEEVAPPAAEESTTVGEGLVLGAQTQEGAEALVGSVLPVNVEQTVVYREVRFALPAGTTEEEAGVTVLPEPQMVKDGTQIGVLENLPVRTGFVIRDFYYDENLEEIALLTDAIERDVTLYPQFVLLEDYDVHVNYIADSDASADIQVVLVSYGLSEARIREKVIVHDIGASDGANGYTLTKLPDPAPDLGKLIGDEEKRAAAQKAIDGIGQEDMSLSQQLIALELDRDVVEAIVSYWSPQELPIEWPEPEPDLNALIEDAEARRLAREAIGRVGEEGFSLREALAPMEQIDEETILAILRYWSPEELPEELRTAQSDVEADEAVAEPAEAVPEPEETAEDTD